MVLTSGGWNLHLSPRSNTGYEGVTFLRARRGKQYRVRAPSKALIGYFDSPVAAAEHYARHVGDKLSVRPELSRTYTYPSGEQIDLHLAVSSAVGYWGVSFAASGSRTKRYVARLGPSRIDFIGYYACPLDAAVAIAEAVRARDAVVGSLCSAQPLDAGAVDDMALADADILDLLATSDSMFGDADGPFSGAVALAPAFGLGGAVTGRMHRSPTADACPASRGTVGTVGGDCVPDGDG